MLKIVPRSRIPPDEYEVVDYKHTAPKLGDMEPGSLIPLMSEPAAMMRLARSCSMNQLEARDGRGNTLLYWAAAEGREDLVNVLLYRGVDPNLQNYSAETPLFVATTKGFLTICQKLLEFGANPNIANLDGASPLHAAAAEGDVNAMYLLLYYGAYINAQDLEGDTPLHWAVREGKLESIQFLVESKANIQLVNEDLETPSELASCIEETSILEYLTQVEKVLLCEGKPEVPKGQEPK